MGVLLDVLSWILLVVGGFFAVSGGLGVLRFPDFFSRIHAAGVTDTFGAGMILTGLMLQAPDFIAVAKLVFILAFLWLTNPTATHALGKAAIKGGLPLVHSSTGTGEGGASSSDS